MKNIIWIILVFALIFGYIVGNIFPFNSSFSAEKLNSIRGEAQLIVVAKMENNNVVVPNLEIDLAQQPGQPPAGGVVITDQNGVAEFNVKPGSYFLYFNQNTFPKNLRMPEPEQIIVEDGIINEKTILLNIK